MLQTNDVKQTDRQIDRQMVQKSAPADWGPNYKSVFGVFFLRFSWVIKLNALYDENE